MIELEALLRENADPLLYLAFFGSLIIFGLMEARGTGDLRRSQRWPANGVVTLLNIAVMSALPVSGLMVADRAFQAGWGLLNMVALPIGITIVLGILGRSLVSWVLHVLMHKVPVLWRLHRVHHADDRLDVSTTVRFHPMETLVSTPFLLAGTFLLGIPPVAVLVYELVDAVLAVFSHANLRLSDRADRYLSALIVTPNLHRIHHSPARLETDSNFGATLTLWDRLFRTFRRKSVNELNRQPVGLDDVPAPSGRSIGWMLRAPFASFTSPRETV